MYTANYNIQGPKSSARRASIAQACELRCTITYLPYNGCRKVCPWAKIFAFGLRDERNQQYATIANNMHCLKLCPAMKE